ncbi:AEC family transporter [Ponticaulis sp.]|uniref:AEC family transporter n=1 Tax=Ponticaulis sp. TaxID=2020902 RepID=UPI000B744D4E|nr:AEC family transporter [Ponticaulis sp.]MAI89161.1 transporter [Ponticaulis sp.]OUY01158.1 MAG: transporter [Hyphomonadaceae bacterium TMED5]|tara:strand:- start:107029 stop:107976 length:948 start_codon:yes stop_codon:yes gene_type:complete
MLSTLFIVLPIFALIFAGWAARRFGALGPTALREINRFVVYLALPALMFDVIATSTIEQIWLPGFILAYSTGCFSIFIVAVLIRLKQKAALADAAVDGLSAGYANTAYMGFPLLLAVYGEPGLTPALIASILTVTIIFCFALVLIECSIQTGGNAFQIARKATLSLISNPLLIAPAAGAVVLLSGFTLPSPVTSFLDLLGSAASPCALVALGLFFAESSDKQEGTSASIVNVTWLTVLKLFIQPFITWVLAGPVLNLPPFLLYSSVFIAAMPTGTGPFMLAEFYGRNARLSGQVILVSTIISILTLSIFLQWIEH